MDPFPFHRGQGSHLGLLCTPPGGSWAVGSQPQRGGYCYVSSSLLSLVTHVLSFCALFYFVFTFPLVSDPDFLPLCDFPGSVIVSPAPNCFHLFSPTPCINVPCLPLSCASSSRSFHVKVQDFQPYLHVSRFLFITFVYCLILLVSAFCLTFLPSKLFLKTFH